jgi:crotonobetainyl-CoA:carnitine CoA-transferase CaiB-like acyl-CoA transferase
VQALEGLRVLDLTRLLPGAVATQLLRDFGAEVIKVEAPGVGDYARSLLTTDGNSPIFAATNRGKKSIVLDLKQPDGRDALLRLAENADVLIEGFRPGVMARLGLSYEELHKRNDRLIAASLTGFGQHSPYSDLAGHDINYLAMAGVLDLIGAKDGPPAIPGIQIADLAGGAMQVVIGILLALAARERTGKGQFIDVSMMDGSAAMLTIALATGAKSKRGDDTLSGRYACYNVYECKDGRWLSVGALETKFWQNLCRELDREDLIADQFSGEPRQSEIKAALVSTFRERTAGDWFAVLGPKDCCVAPVRTVAEASADIRPVPNLSETPARLDGMPPASGEHNEEILK